MLEDMLVFCSKLEKETKPSVRKLISLQLIMAEEYHDNNSKLVGRMAAVFRCVAPVRQ